MTRAKQIIKGIFFTIFWIIGVMVLQSIYASIAVVIRCVLDSRYLLKLYDIFNSADTNKYIDIYSGILTENMLGMEILCVTGLVGFYIIDRQFKKGRFGINKIKCTKISYFILIGVVLNILTTIGVSIVPDEIVNNSGFDTSYVYNGSFIGMLIAVGLLGPIYEEIAFRYFVFHNANRINTIVAIIVSSLVFGIAHGNIVQGTYAAIYGIIFVIIDIKNKSIIPSIIMHITINTLSMLTILGTTSIGLLIIYSVALTAAIIASVASFVIDRV